MNLEEKTFDEKFKEKFQELNMTDNIERKVDIFTEMLKLSDNMLNNTDLN